MITGHRRRRKTTVQDVLLYCVTVLIIGLVIVILAFGLGYVLRGLSDLFLNGWDLGGGLRA